ncbi:MAG: hypothetical protein K0S32_3957 [Bacteroidetes bacterium]|jgi:hypothetical protein|nr:hypothetical protein [Bacteroidota bacterium]
MLTIMYDPAGVDDICKTNIYACMTPTESESVHAFAVILIP